MTAVTYAKNQMLTGEELAQIQVEGVEFPKIFRDYEQALRQSRRMDYDDQMVYAMRILRQHPRILEEFQSRYRYFCVDEAQDTSKIQHRIIRLLAGKSRNLFLVGDEDQSIYGFRAADPSALIHFPEDWPGARVLRLEQNYRSTQEIVAAADRFIQKNTNRLPKHMRAVRGAGLRRRRSPSMTGSVSTAGWPSWPKTVTGRPLYSIGTMTAPSLSLTCWSEPELRIAVARWRAPFSPVGWSGTSQM